MKYIITGKIEMEVEAENAQEAQINATVKFNEFEKVGAKITEASVVDKASGYFVS